MSKRLDIIILGATGFTGMHCIPYMHKMAKSNGRNLTWGVAGRSEDKLKEVLDKMGKTIDTDLSKTPIVLCNIKDSKSLLEMAKQAKIVINCCGPYRYLGEPVIQACIEAGTHQVDVTGEPQYMELCLSEYNDGAETKGVYIVSACGFDCIPVDMGIVHIQQKFPGTLNSVTSYLEAGFDKKALKDPKGPTVNYGTWESLVESIANWKELREFRKKANWEKLPTFTPKLCSSFMPQKSKVVEGWVLPFLGADKSVARRTQRHMYKYESQRPVQVDTKFVVKSFFSLLGFIIGGLFMLLMSQLNFTKKLLLDYPQIFTFGMISKKQQPSKEIIENSWFRVTFYGEGWKEKLANKDDQYDKSCDKAMITRVEGRNPGYGATCASVVASAVIIATESDKIPGKGGILTPGIAFAKTSLLRILNENGITFDVVSEKDL